jgi:hypothetical protein
LRLFVGVKYSVITSINELEKISYNKFFKSKIVSILKGKLSSEIPVVNVPIAKEVVVKSLE